MKNLVKKLPLVVAVLTGALIISSFALRNSSIKNVRVMHKGHVIEIAFKALPYHLSHGDFIVRPKPVPGPGPLDE